MKEEFKNLWEIEKMEDGFIFKSIYYDKVRILVEAETEDEAWVELYNFVND